MEKVADSGLRERVRTAVKEIADEMTANTLDRMATYNRFAAGNQTPPENKLALAISGWLLGAGEAIEDLPRALSIVDLRDLVRHYLQETDRVRRDADLKKIMASEAITPKFIAGLAAHMTPPIETPPQQTPGLYELSVGPNNGDPAVTYLVQLPPEYDPHSSYPCIVTLHGGGSNPKQQIDWWNIQAARHGYIVIAPAWTKPHQGQYEGTSREHDAVLSTLRHACRRFAIDTDRVFLSGHSIGGNAAWEIGLAHPDLWAGVIPIVPSANKIVQQYKKNAEHGAALLCLRRTGWRQNGEKRAGIRSRTCKSAAPRIDCTVVEYEGRGHEHFSDEILRLFDWMGRKQRNFFPKQFDAVTQPAVRQFFLVAGAARFPTARARISPTAAT